jgi:hypothetical protein
VGSIPTRFRHFGLLALGDPQPPPDPLHPVDVPATTGVAFCKQEEGMTLRILLLAAAVGAVLLPPQEPKPDPASNCTATAAIREQPPDEANASTFDPTYWYVNADRTVWAVLGPKEDSWWRTGGWKVFWIRPAGTQLTITGRRLDAQAAPLRARIPCCYPAGFQATGLDFPTEGCWDVTAKAGDHTLHITTRVERASR